MRVIAEQISSSAQRTGFRVEIQELKAPKSCRHWQWNIDGQRVASRLASVGCVCICGCLLNQFSMSTALVCSRPGSWKREHVQYSLTVSPQLTVQVCKCWTCWWIHTGLDALHQSLSINKKSTLRISDLVSVRHTTFILSNCTGMILEQILKSGRPGRSGHAILAVALHSHVQKPMINKP